MQEAEPVDTREIRNGAALAFVGFLLGVAVQEMVTPVRDALQHSGLSIDNTALAVVFLLTAVTAFILGYFNLVVSDYRGRLWLANFLLFVTEAVLLVFMGGVATVGLSAHARFGFFDFLIAFYAVDILWLLATPFMVGSDRRTDAWKAFRTYAAVQILPLVFLIALSILTESWYADGPIVAFSTFVTLDFVATMGLAARNII